MDQDTDIPPEGPAEQGRGPVASLFTSIAQMLATGIGIAHTRLELLTTELQEEMHRVATFMVLSAIALLAAGVGLFSLSLAVIIVFWDTHRVAASIGVTATFFLIAVVAGLVLARRYARSRRCSMLRWPSSRKTAPTC